MNSSITMKFTIAYFAAAILIIMSFSLLVFENQIDLIGENALLRSLQTGNLIEKEAEAAASYDAIISALLEKQHLHIRYIHIFNENNQLAASSDPTDPAVENPATFRAIQTAVTKRDFESSDFHHELNLEKRLVDLYIPLDLPSAEPAILMAGIYIEDIDSRMNALFRQSGLLTIAVILIHMAFALFTYRSLISPLNQIIKALDEIGRGNYTVHFPAHRKDEFGVLSRKIEEMSESIHEEHHEAKNANPLTGLPGNIALEREILKRLDSGNSFCVIYSDLDNFKAYNDAYGFSKGDEVILYTRDVITRSIERSHGRNSFFGHEGGDDFVVVCDYYDWEKIASFCTAFFDEGISAFYSDEDRERGYIVSKDRKGNISNFPLMTISLAVVTNHFRRIGSFGQLIHYAAEMKKVVKSRDGSAFMIDRRTD